MMKNGGSKIRTRGDLFAALDVGTSKVVCFIAKIGDDGRPKVVGIGHQVSHGVKSGVVIDMDAAEKSIRATVEAAEQMAGETIGSVVVSLSAGEPQSKLINFEVSIAGHQIGDMDLRRVLDPTWIDHQHGEERKLIHAIPISYSIDGDKGVVDPRGMFGDRLGVDLHSITASSTAVRNLRTAISRCHLDVEAEVIAPYASGLGVLIEDETELGCTLIDMGGGSTTISVFYDGHLVHTDCLRVGGMHITNDIARGLSTTVAHAERIKTLFGHALPAPSDDQEVIRVPLVGEQEGSSGENQVPRSMLTGIIRPRVEETIELVRSRLEASGFSELIGRHVVLTGGASQLVGVPEIVAQMLDKQVRMGRPVGVNGLAAATGGPAFSTGAGLLKFICEKQAEWPLAAQRPKQEASSPLGKLGNWFRDYF